ncbi:hypothetical protein MYX82_09570, partial [Acidobacteria bacterium AH-259-D05]|nr:hypothetical protein [Acidobacteria bacterium AH-259-D05]
IPLMRFSFTVSLPIEVRKQARNSLVLLLYCSIVLLFSSPALAQGCAMCRTALAGQVESAVQAINLGILVLLVPPIALMSTIVFIAFRHDK